MKGFGYIDTEGEPLCRFTDFDLSTGWYMGSDGVRRFVIDGDPVDRQTWLNYVGENADTFSDPKWTAE